MRRRGFLKTAALAGAGLLTHRLPLQAADAEIEISPGELGPEINPHLYGHFIEHLGGVIYDGIWVGPDSKVPNAGGIRKAFADDMKRIGAPNLRWPGGCFADGYHWRDGIGPREKRPRTYNFWEARMPKGMHHTEPNQFGTHEFMQLCRLVGADPYFAANVGSGSPREFHDWVSYCNAPAGTLSLADERAANGDREPFNVRYWGVGNESWGCGGEMKPGEYATLYRQFITQFPVYTEPFFVATGPRGHSQDMDLDWTRGFFAGLQGHPRSRVHGLGLHFYTDFRPTSVIPEKSTAREWYAVLAKGLLMEPIIEKHWAIMGEFDPEHFTKFVIDEWGTWYATGALIAPGYILSQIITLRDAVHAALTFDVFNRHVEKIAMANIAQTVNCLHSLFLAHEDKYTRTPAYYTFEMYRPHMGARRVPLRIKIPELTVPVLEGTAKLPGLSGSASIREKRLTVTLTNPSLDAAVAAWIRLAGGARVTEARGSVLTHENIAAANTFENPHKVEPAKLSVNISGGAAQVTIPKQAVVALELLIS